MPLTACRHIRKMRGGAQAHLVEAEDGNFYVVKCRENAQHRRILANEWLVSALLRELGIETPATEVVCFPDEFVERSPELTIDFGSRRTRVEAGRHFGSRYPGDPNVVSVYDFIPDSLLETVLNLRDFLGALVVDKWTGNADGRQSVFYRARWQRVIKRERNGGEPRVGFVVSMIDQGFAFNGPHWDFPDGPLQGLYHRPLVYGRVRTADDFQPWLDQVRHFPEHALDRAWRTLPPEWVDGEEEAFEQLLERLWRRRNRVLDLLEDCRRARPGLFPHWTS